MLYRTVERFVPGRNEWVGCDHPFVVARSSLQLSRARPPQDLGAHLPWIRRYAARLVPDPELAEEMAQDTFVAAIERPPPAGTAVRPWLIGILRNVFRMRARTRAQRGRHELTLAPEPLPLPELAVETAQVERLLAKAVASLKEPYRSTLQMHLQDDLTAAEIARRCGLPATTVRSRLQVALSHVRAEIEGTPSAERKTRALVPWLLLGRAARRWWSAVAVGLVAVASILVGAGAPTTGSDRRSSRPFRTPPFQLVPLSERLDQPPPAALPVETDRSPFTSCDPGSMDGTHPRLGIDASRICGVRADLATAARAEILRALATAVSHGRPGFWASPHEAYAWGDLAHAAALLFLITGDATHAQRAYDFVLRMYDARGATFRMPEEGAPLHRSWTGMRLAFVYDWAYHGLSSRQRENLQHRLRQALAAWQRLDHHNLRPPYASSWVAATRGTELLQRLALGLDGDRTEQLVGLLRAHVQAAYGHGGMSDEGLGALSYAGSFLLPAARSLRLRGDARLHDDLGRLPFWKIAMFADVLPAAAARPDTKQQVSRLRGAGWRSLLFDGLPDDERSLYAAYYDRQVGHASALPATQRYESQNGGLIWALLSHPSETASAEQLALAALGRSFADTQRGAFFFRSGWRAGVEVALSFAGDFQTQRHVGDEWHLYQLGLSIDGQAIFDGRRKTAEQAALLVDGRSAADGPRAALVGSLLRYEPRADGGMVIVDGTRRYRGLGVNLAERQLDVRFAAADQEPTWVSTWDKLRADEPHRYTWQVIPARAGLPITVHARGFTITGEQGLYVRGWVVSPADASVTLGDTLAVHAEGRGVDLQIVMAVGRGTPPESPR